MLVSLLVMSLILEEKKWVSTRNQIRPMKILLAVSGQDKLTTLISTILNPLISGLKVLWISLKTTMLHQVVFGLTWTNSPTSSMEKFFPLNNALCQTILMLPPMNNILELLLKTSTQTFPSKSAVLSMFSKRKPWVMMLPNTMELMLRSSINQVRNYVNLTSTIWMVSLKELQPMKHWN